jgi:integrase
MALTAAAIKAAKATGKRQRLSDGHGLHLEVDPQGRKYWNWVFYLPKEGGGTRRAEMRLGKWDEKGNDGLSLAQAREQRAEWEAIRKQGNDPRRVKKEQRLQRYGLQENARFEAAAWDWYERMRRGDWSERNSTDTRRKLELHILPCLGPLKLEEIRVAHARVLLEPLEAAGKVETARKCLAIASQVLDHAVVNQWLTANPLASSRRALALRPAKRHYPSIPWSEVPGLWQAAERYSAVMDLQTYNALRLQALTFVRPGELIGMRWEEIDWERQQWLIPAVRMKGRRGHHRDHIVPLSTQALAVLRAQEQINGHRGYVFHSSRSQSSHISNMSVNMALNRMGYQGRMCAHGFRALAMTALQEEQGIDRLHLDRQLAHVPESKVAAAYNRAEYLKERTALMQVWGDMLEGAGMTLPARITD